LLPLELGLADLPQVICTAEGAARIRNGNPGQVIGHHDFGTEVWGSFQGAPVAVGHYRGGELHPSRVFNL
jgi:tRNA pseudouridine55 synthase